MRTSAVGSIIEFYRVLPSCTEVPSRHTEFDGTRLGGSRPTFFSSSLWRFIFSFSSFFFSLSLNGSNSASMVTISPVERRIVAGPTLDCGCWRPTTTNGEDVVAASIFPLIHFYFGPLFFLWTDFDFAPIFSFSIFLTQTLHPILPGLQKKQLFFPSEFHVLFEFFSLFDSIFSFPLFNIGLTHCLTAVTEL